MSFLEWAGPAAGLLGAATALVGLLLQRRGQGSTERQADERLGHDDLVSSLSVLRGRAEDAEQYAERLEQRVAKAEEAERQWQTKFDKERRERLALEQRVTDLLLNLERRPEL